VSTGNVASDPSEAYEGGLFSQQRVLSYAEIVSSRPVIQAVIRKLRLRQSVEELQAAIEVSVPRDTVLINVTVEDRSPRRAKAIADVVAAEFASFVKPLETPEGRGNSPVKVSVTSPARLPTDPVAPRKLVVYLALGALWGLTVGLGAVLLREALAKRVRDEEGAAVAAGAAVLGSIPDDPHADSRPLIVVDDPSSVRAEAYRRLRTNLETLIVDRQVRSFVVSSAVESEGKTVIVANLGVALAQAGYRVILVDADLRRPKLAQMLGLSSSAGLTDVLVDDLPVETAVETWREGVPLEVIGGGRARPKPGDLLGSESFRAVLTALMQRADVVILDAPAVLPVGDAAMVAQATSGVILVSRAESTRTAQLEAAAEALRATGEPVIAVVLNRVPMRAWAYRGGVIVDRADRSRRASEPRGRLQKSEQPGTGV
jgi:non-specific protein-tyrosine kinase